jgi:hypothetical protein
MAHNGWVGVDLDSTLAFYDRWRGPKHIGAPIEKMRARILKLFEAGVEVRIFTARVSPTACALNGNTLEETRKPIEDWCLEHLGRVLPVTHEKDMSMIMLYDDRCKQVVPNTGECVDGSE